MSRTVVMGILNVTPDSFADGGKYLSKTDAITQGRRLIAEGTDIIDVGGESTRPGAERISEEEELARVIPVITELVKDGAEVSVDTMRAEVAKEAIAVGATYINDVSGGLADEKMAAVIASNPKVQYIVMHWRGHSKNMQELAIYKDVVKENDWYMKYNTTREKEALFIKEATKILKTKLRMSKAVAEKEISWFILQWGLTTNAENYSDETTLVKSKSKNTRKKSK